MKAIWFFFLLLAATPAFAEWGEIIPPGALQGDKPWVESPVSLPAYPNAADLLPFSVSSLSTFHYALDKASVSVEPGGLVRYAVLVTSAQDAVNVSYEGIRCAAQEYKIYAIGVAGKWQPVRDPVWRPIQQRSPYSYRRALMDDAFCPDGNAVASPAQAFDNLQKGHGW